jgi:hypothetical protein
VATPTAGGRKGKSTSTGFQNRFGDPNGTGLRLDLAANRHQPAVECPNPR